MSEMQAASVRPNIIRSLLIAPVIGIAATAAGIILPALAITLISLFVNSTDLMAVALLIAEPFSLIGAAGVTLLFAAKRERSLPGLAWPLLVAAASSAGVTVRSLWVGDIDAWILMALVLLPLVAIWSARRSA